jgi:hypothetical protein
MGTGTLHRSNTAPISGAAIAPHGPTGLWGALVRVSTPSVTGRALPVMEVAGVGARVSNPMFDYDAELAESLGAEAGPWFLLS